MKSLLRWLRERAIRKFKGGAAAARFQGVTVGENSRILTNRFGSEPWLVSIGSRVTVSSGVQFLTHDGVGWLYRDDAGRRYRYAPISIGDNCFIGYGSIIMPGVEVGSEVVVGAGSVVTRSVPSGTVVAGNPARQLTTYGELMERVRKWPSDRDVGARTAHERVSLVIDSLPSSIVEAPITPESTGERQ